LQQENYFPFDGDDSSLLISLGNLKRTAAVGKKKEVGEIG
jgi:hypothetical protein